MSLLTVRCTASSGVSALPERLCIAPFFFPPSPQTVGVNERRREEEEEETLLNVTLSPSNPARSTHVHRLVPCIRERGEKVFERGAKMAEARRKIPPQFCRVGREGDWLCYEMFLWSLSMYRMRSSALWGMSHHGKRIVTKGKGEGAPRKVSSESSFYTQEPLPGWVA